MDVLSVISNKLIKKPRKTKKKLEDFKIISPTSPLKQQIKEALKSEIDFLVVFCALNLEKEQTEFNQNLNFLKNEK